MKFGMWVHFDNIKVDLEGQDHGSKVKVTRFQNVTQNHVHWVKSMSSQYWKLANTPGKWSWCQLGITQHIEITSKFLGNHDMLHETLYWLDKRVTLCHLDQFQGALATVSICLQMMTHIVYFNYSITFEWIKVDLWGKCSSFNMYAMINQG